MCSARIVQACVPPPPTGHLAVPAGPPAMGPRHEFNIACPRCETLLESHTGLNGQPGRCPACGAKILVPEVNRRTGRPQRSQLLDDGGEAPAPIHAYAASGLQAPRIFRRADGTQVIECPRAVPETCPVDSDSCPACHTPFTAEVVPSIRSYKSNRRAQIALFWELLLCRCACCSPALAAVVFGTLSLGLGSGSRPPVAGIVGITLAALSLAGGLLLFLL